MKKLLLILCVAMLATFTACGPKVPPGMPKTIPCYVTVVKGSEPIADAQIILYTEAGGSLTVCGTTDASGRADISTILATYVGKGAPAGEYKVTVLKEVPIEHTKTPEQIEKMTPPEAEKYEMEMQKQRDSKPRIVPKAFTEKATTPFSVTVTPESAGKELVKIDVANAKGAAAPAKPAAAPADAAKPAAAPEKK